MKRFYIVLGLCVLPLAALGQDQEGSPNGSVRVAMASARQHGLAPVEPISPFAPCVAQMDDASLRELVAKEAKSAGVDEKLALVILSLESSDGANLNSPKGARGPMMLMPDTAAEYGVKDICNPVENVQGSIKFLKDLSAQFSGNVMLIAAAYNAGSERVYNAGGVPSNSETVRYTAQVVNKYYGLAEVTARRGKSGEVRQKKSAPAEHAEAAKKPNIDQNWIGGSVLYVRQEGEGGEQ